MATEAQVVANRRNAEKSTGPRTPEGKAAVSQNAVKHGLSAQHDVIRGEEQVEFDQYREELFWELNPLGTMECRLAERVVSLAWRLRRAERIHNEVFDALLAKEASSRLDWLTGSLRSGGSGNADGADIDLSLGATVAKDFSNDRVLDRLLMYERRIESSLYRTMNELEKLRRTGKSEARDAETGRRTRREAKEDSRIGANGGHSPPYEIDYAKQSQSMDTGTTHPGSPKTDAETPYGVTTGAAGGAKQSQSPPMEGVHGTPYESDSAKQSQSLPRDGGQSPPCESDCAKQSQLGGAETMNLGSPRRGEETACGVTTNVRCETKPIEPVGGVHGTPCENGSAPALSENVIDPAKQSQSLPVAGVHGTPCEIEGVSPDHGRLCETKPMEPVGGVHGTPCEGGEAGPDGETPCGVTTSAGDGAKQSSSIRQAPLVAAEGHAMGIRVNLA